MVQMKIDFHTHTFNSYDSRMTPAKILRVAKKRGLDGIVICDHNTIKGGLMAKEINRDENFTVIVGAEVASDAGDVTGIFLTEEIRSKEFSDVAKEIKAQGGKVILNHPYKHHDLSKVDFSLVDYIEGYNARCSKRENEKAVALAKQHNLPVIAGSDSHLYNEIANCMTEVDNIESLKPVSYTINYSHQLNITLSQFTKAYKRRSCRVFINALKNFIKKSL
jgi:predicted metal-dependent phosphoesterase TrpH